MRTIILSIILLTSISISAQDFIPKRIYNTNHIGTNESVKIDGLVNEEAWNLVEWSTDYIQWSPNENTQPIEQTKMKILYDDKNLYVAFRCYDKDPKEIVNRLSRRDGFDGD